MFTSTVSNLQSPYKTLLSHNQGRSLLCCFCVASEGLAEVTVVPCLFLMWNYLGWSTSHHYPSPQAVAFWSVRFFWSTVSDEECPDALERGLNGMWEGRNMIWNCLLLYFGVYPERSVDTNVNTRTKGWSKMEEESWRETEEKLHVVWGINFL